MNITKQDILQSGLSQKDYRQLVNQHRGGLNNEKGSDFELYFVLYQLVRLQAQYLLTAAQIRAAKQIQCFVDDLWIEESPSSHSFFQLKNVQRPSWTQKLKRDFTRQEQVNTSQGIQATLYLVVSKQNKATNLQKNRPSHLRTAQVMYFPECKNLEALYQKYPSFKSVLMDICAIKSPEKNHLDTLASSILLYWQQTAVPNAPIAIDRFFEQIAQQHVPAIYLKQSHLKLPCEWVQAQVILDNIPGLTYTVDTGFLTTSYKAERYHFPYSVAHTKFAQFLKVLINNPPQNYTALEEYFYA